MADDTNNDTDTHAPDDADGGRHHSHDHGRHDAATYFDDEARDWDDDAKVERVRVMASAIRGAVEVDASTRVLEYGAGTGLGTQHLAVGGIGPVTLAEPSAGMRAVMEDKIADGLLPEDARVVDLDLAVDQPPDTTFDVVLTVMTLHHIPDLDRVLEGFASLLAPDGAVCILDLVAEDGSFHRHLDGFDGHDGFTREGLGRRLSAAGFSAPTWDVVHTLDKDGETYPLFLAIARLEAPRP